MIYLDNSATTKQYKSVTQAMLSVMDEHYGNPSSLHTMGVSAERLVKQARKRVAAALQAPEQDVYFTSGGTEGNNLALLGAYRALRIKGGVVTTRTEHKSVLEPLKTLANVTYLDVDKDGQISLEQLEQSVTDATSLVSVMHVNNEVGTIAPIAEIAGIIKSKNPKCLFHVDAVQSFCKLAFPKNAADLITVSAHKIHGPKGVGAVYVKKGVRISPLVYGGGQEGGLRSGTENTAAIAGFGVAADTDTDISYVRHLNKILCEGLKDVIFNSSPNGSPYILNVSVPGIRSEILLHSLEQRGVMVSSGSACSSNRPSPSHVLTAMGLSKEIIDSSIRISLSMMNTIDEVTEAAKIITAVIENIKTRLRRS